jgi:hypothetical protein
VRRQLTVFFLVLAAAGLAATAASARPDGKLTAKESKWMTPMLNVWTTMNAGLHIVIQQAAAQDALIAGTPNNGKLTRTLTVFVECSPIVAKAGKPPTARLVPFDTSLKALCLHLGNGAHDLAKAVGAIQKKNSKLATTLIKAMDAEFKRASSYLKQAEAQALAVGGSNVFKA